ncbi:MAG: hypothetical protein SGARI_001067, partial [Bacillariaceae sp.]
DYLGDNFNLAQLPPIVERIGFQAMGENATFVAKALQEHRANLEAAAGGSMTKAQRAAMLYPIYRQALQLILKEGGSVDEESTPESMIIPPYAIQAAAEALYLMVHARFVISPRGLEAIRHVMMMDRTVFGKCPRPLCKGCGTLPYGYNIDYTSAESQGSSPSPQSLCHRYCPSCGEVWISWNSKTDGCAWGPSWCHLFLLTFGTSVFAEELDAILVQQESSSMPRTGVPEQATASAKSVLTSPPPTVFGFRIHPETPFGRPFNDQSLRVSGGASSSRGRPNTDGP